MHDHRHSRRTEVLLQAGVDHAELPVVDDPRQDLGGLIGDQRHAAGLRKPLPTGAAHRVVAGDVQVGGGLVDAGRSDGGDAAEAVGRSGGKHLDGGKGLRIIDGQLRKIAGLGVQAGPGGRTPGQVERQGGELHARAAVHEENAVVGGDGGQFAQQRLGLVLDRLELLAAVADLDDRGAHTAVVEELVANPLHNRQRQHGRPGTEIVNPVGHSPLL